MRLLQRPSEISQGFDPLELAEQSPSPGGLVPGGTGSLIGIPRSLAFAPLDLDSGMKLERLLQTGDATLSLLRALNERCPLFAERTPRRVIEKADVGTTLFEPAPSLLSFVGLRVSTARKLGIDLSAGDFFEKLGALVLVG